MIAELSTEEQSAAERFRSHVTAELLPNADEFDANGAVPRSLLASMAQAGYWGAAVPSEFGGKPLAPVTMGLLCKELGRGSASVLSLFTVHSMVCQAVARWGTAAQRERWLPRFARGESFAAFALTESDAGSDAKRIACSAERTHGHYVLEGRKKWISFGQTADCALVIAQSGGKALALLVESATPGYVRAPIGGMLGFRAAQLADIELAACAVPSDQLIGREGMGFSHVALSALDWGRYCIAWGCTGLLQGCLDASLAYASTRKQFGVTLDQHQLVQRMLANMFTDLNAAELLCWSAGRRRECGQESMMESSLAKYFASAAAMRAALDAVQIHGANGCSSDFPVARYLRDAKITEIIEGSSEMQQLMMARHARQANA